MNNVFTFHERYPIMVLTSDDILTARKISQAIQNYIAGNFIKTALRTPEAYEALVKQNLVERDRHNGIKFRNFLKHLMDTNAIHLIPQVRIEKKGDGRIDWYFENAGKKTDWRRLTPVSKFEKDIAIDGDRIQSELNKIPRRNESSLNPIELETRKSYPRAYELWSYKEEKLLKEVVKVITDPFELSKIFGRQPSAIQKHLRIFGIYI